MPNRNKTIIDFGAGTGRISLPLSEKGYCVTAVEPSSEMLKVLTKKSKVKNLHVKVVNTTIQEYKPKEEADLGLLLYTVLSYLTTEKELETAIKVMNASIRKGGYILLDIASKLLFQSSLIQTSQMNRDIKIEMIDDEIYTYTEACSGEIDGKKFSYRDIFTIRNWSVEYVIEKMLQSGFEINEKISNDLINSGSDYYLFQKIK